MNVVSTAEAWAPSNIALVKYWGKRDAHLNLPAMGSLSVTLKGLVSQTRVERWDVSGSTRLVVDGAEVAGNGLQRLDRMVSFLRERTGLEGKIAVTSTSNFPMGAGIASSASGMAAAALALSAAYEWDARPEEVSALARLGSGSACRSLFGGFVEWQVGNRSDGEDSHGKPYLPPEHWPLDVLVVVVDSGPKFVSSSAGMAGTAESSPYYEAWVGSGEADLRSARSCIAARDFEGLGRIAESSTLKMHASMMTGVPPLLYWRPGTLVVLEWVRRLKDSGIACFFSMDAGPNVKLFFPPGTGAQYRIELEALPEVECVLESGVGPGGGLGKWCDDQSV